MNEYLNKVGQLLQPLTDSDTHVWCFSVDLGGLELEGHYSLLSSDEKARAERFYFESDRNRYIAARGFLRTLIAGYMEIDPSELEFIYGKSGKPALKSQSEEKNLEFNVSHSKDLALYIFNRSRPVGIDVEFIRPMPDMNDFAKQFFSSREANFLNSLSVEKKPEAFFTLWTCKEALLKAHGSGLLVPLSAVEIDLGEDGAANLTAIDGDSEQASRWRLESFSPVMGYRAAIVIEEGHDSQVVMIGQNASQVALLQN